MAEVNSEGGRLNLIEIKREARKRFSFELVDGVDSILENSRTQRNNGWVASFLDARCAYYVHQNGKDFLEWKTQSVPPTQCSYVVFVFSIGMGFGSSLPQPSGQFEVYFNNEYLLSFRVTKENELWRGNKTVLYFWKKKLFVAPPYMSLHMDDHIKEEFTACYGLAFMKVPAGKVRQGENVIKVVPKNGQFSSRWFKLDLSKWANPILKAHISTGLNVIHKKDRISSEINGYRVAFGDIHTHSGIGHTKNRPCGLGSIDNNYTYARDIACLDFYSLTDHDWQLTEEDWQLRMDKADEYNKGGTFVTIPGFEWTSTKYGHRNVYYATTDGSLLKSHPKDKVNAIDDESETLDMLWKKLDQMKVSAITVPHHPSVSYFPVDWRYRNEKYERLVEIYSCWGNSEYQGAPFSGVASDRHPDFSVLEALKSGHKLGIIASSDGHDGHPGNAQWSFRQPHLHPWLGSGRVAVLVSNLTRKDIFNALYSRRCYATTGTRILLDFQVNGQCMGSEIAPQNPDEERNIEIFIKGTSPIKSIHLVTNRGKLHTWQLDGQLQETRLFFQDKTGIDQSIFYYIRVIQMDGGMAWSSPIWITYHSKDKKINLDSTS